MKYSEQEMAALISEVETQFSEYLAKAENQENNLKKSEKAEEEKIEKSEETEVEEETEELAKSEKSELDYDEEDYLEMDKLYQSMSKAEREAHYQSLKKSLFSEEEKIEKSEETESEVKEEKMKKSEKAEEENIEKSEMDSLKKENDELKKSLEKLTSALTKFVKTGAPKRKAVTKIEYIKKSEAEEQAGKEEKVDVSKLNKKEISQRLSEKIRTGELKKSDKEAINNYYLSEKPNIDSIKHLL